MRPLHVELRRQFPSLRRLGIAVEHFPAYRNPRPSRPITHDILYGSLLLSGEVTHHVDDTTYREAAGSLSIVHYGVAHQIVTGREPVEVFNLYLDPQRHALPALPSAIAAQVHRLLALHAGLGHRLNRLTRVTLLEPARTVTWLHALAHEQQRADAAGDAALLALGQLLLLDIGRAVAAQEGPVAVGAEVDPRMEAVRAHLDTRFADEIALADLARLAGLSAPHLCRRFARYAGCPPFTYLRNRRLADAMLRLRSGEERVLAIALACGFSDLAHFNRCFKAAAGCTPRAYRARFRAADHADG
jgi:AraC-like DNA-binding protein